MRRRRRARRGLVAGLVALGALGALGGCAGGRPMAAAAGAPSVAREAEAEPGAEYERILGSYAIDPNAVLLLTPSLCDRFCPRTDPLDTLDTLRGLRDRFRSLGAARGQAAAELNLGALLWFTGDAEAAYAALMRARALFASSGDVQGLAHTFEWLGYAFIESGAEQQAADHLSVAYRLFELLAQPRAQARVLGLTGDGA